MNVKARGLEALKKAKDCQNFWLLLNYWKSKSVLEPGLFSVYVCGPPNTRKTRLVERFKKLWPGCIAKEGSDARIDHMECWEGFDLVLKTGRGAKQLANGLIMDWLFITIEKCRCFGTLREPEPGGGRLGTPPHMYDLTPFWSTRVLPRYA
jgi:hypothetical protein